MLKKRLIGVVTVRNGWAVQSFGYHRYLPLGKPECLVENLDRWGADEILVQVIDRPQEGAHPDFGLLRRLARLGLGTPLIYGGGIRSTADGVDVVQNGADRIAIDMLLRTNVDVVRELSSRLGGQAVIASLPMCWENQRIGWHDYHTRGVRSLPECVGDLIQQGSISEVLLSDCQHEGAFAAFDEKLIDCFPVANATLIAFGGITDVSQVQRLLRRPNVAAVAVGNSLNYREHAVQQFREALASPALRAPIYHVEYPLVRDV